MLSVCVLQLVEHGGLGLRECTCAAIQRLERHALRAKLATACPVARQEALYLQRRISTLPRLICPSKRRDATGCQQQFFSSASRQSLVSVNARATLLEVEYVSGRYPFAWGKRSQKSGRLHGLAAVEGTRGRRRPFKRARGEFPVPHWSIIPT